ncbi:MAG: hypothetical protein O3C40_18515 [Planctomycetota bacterium]|nr:hypothetical protein [Planctomycetota bacterium]
MRRFVTCFCILALLVSASGCRRPDQIERYQVARAKSPHRMLGAIVPRGERGWFFKLTGANEFVAQQADNFTAFIESIQFGEGDEADPEWKLPEGWTQEPGNDIRFATIKIATDEQPLELTVSPLPMPPTDGMLSNINRWRGQLGLAPVDAAGLAKETTAVKLADGTATLVNLVGKSGSSAPMASPFAGGSSGDADAARRAAHAAAGVGEPASGEAPAAPPSSITYEAPPEWELGQRVVSRSAFAVPREAAFVVNEDDRKVEITITAAGGDVLLNVNRWRSQIGLEPFTEEQLAAEAQKVDMNGVEGEYFRLIGPQQAILGVIATHGGRSWFVKLYGDHDLAVKLQEQFETFVRSIEF